MNLISTQAIYVMWLRQMKRFVRARSRLVGQIIQPFFFLAIFGFGLNTGSFSGIPSGFNYIDFLSPGIIAMSVLFSSIFAGISVLWDKQFGFLKEVLVAPVSRFSIIVGRTFGGATTALIQGFIVLGMSLLLGVKFSFSGLLLGILFMVLISFTAVGFGLLVASRMEDFHGFQVIMNLIVLPLFFLSSAMFPLDGLPTWLKNIAYLNPLTYGVDGLRRSLIGFSYIPLSVDLVVLSSVCILMLALGTYSFGKSEV